MALEAEGVSDDEDDVSEDEDQVEILNEDGTVTLVDIAKDRKSKRKDRRRAKATAEQTRAKKLRKREKA